MKIGVMLRTLEEKQGIGIYARNLMHAILQIDKENHYFFMYANTQQVGSFGKHDNLTEHALNGKSKLLWDQVLVAKYARKNKLDIVFNTKFSVPLLAGCNTMMVLHGSEWYVHPEFYSKLDILYNKIVLPVYCRRAAAISCVSKVTADDMVGFARIKPKKVHVIHSAIADHFAPVKDSDTLERVRKKYRLPSKYILFVGKIYPGKNFKNIARAFKKVKEEIDSSIKLVSVGDLRWSYDDDFRLIQELGIVDDIHFTGWVEQKELPAIYSLAELFLFPSFYEGFGIPILEAMACGCPVVTANTGACPEVAGGAAILVDPRFAEDIAKGVADVLENTERRKKLIEDGLMRARTFSWQQTASDTISVFGTLTN